MIAKQAALFRVQLWHIRRMKSLTRILRSFTDQDLDPKFQRYLRRQIAQHRRLIDSITPFLLPP